MPVNPPRRSQADRSAATCTALVAAARPLFAERGFGAVGTEEIVRAAGVTRGALYHQFANKTELFAAVYETIEAELVQRLGAAVDGADLEDALALLRLGANAWLDACMEPDVQRIVLLDGPAVLGWLRWREIAMKYGFGLVESLLRHLMESGQIPADPVSATASVLMGALDEGALYIALAEDQQAARADVQVVLERLLAGFTA